MRSQWNLDFAQLAGFAESTREVATTVGGWKTRRNNTFIVRRDILEYGKMHQLESHDELLKCCAGDVVHDLSMLDSDDRDESC